MTIIKNFPNAGPMPEAVELYSSGTEACIAGLLGVHHPGKKAKALIDKLLKLKAKTSPRKP